MTEVKTDCNTDKKNEKQVDISCWNCFSTEDHDKDLDSITLPKVREKHREKLKLYSFFASELTKPKTVPLKQKVSEQYIIGKRIDENLSKKTELVKNESNRSENLDIGKNDTNNIKESSIHKSENAISVLPNRESVVEIEYKNSGKTMLINENPPTQTSYCDSHNHTPTTSPSIMSKDKSQTSSLKNADKIYTDYTPNAHKKNDEEILSNNNSSSQFEIRQVSALEEPEHYTLVTIKEANDSMTQANKPLTKTRFGLLRKSILREKPVPEKVLLAKDANENLPKEVIDSVSKPSLDGLQTSRQKAVHKQSAIRAEDHSKINYRLNNVLERKRKNSDSIKTDRDLEPIDSVVKISSNDDKSKLAHENNANVNVLYEVQIETPYNEKSDIVRIPFKKVKECENSRYENTKKAILHSKEEAPLFDKEDNNSSIGSESGYAGSSVPDLFEETIAKSAKLGNIEENYQQGNTKELSETEKLNTSLPSFNKSVEKTILKTSSLASGIDNAGSKPALKSLRWSTLSVAPRSFNSEDEIYVSDSVSPGHATLPRRSNSPLPHERDMDRDRFPLNRSGLQARSESMASVYSGAGEGMRGNVTVRGEVQFSLVYNYRLGALEVGVKRCRDLAPVDVKRNRSDPYVKVYLLPDKSKAGKRKTKVKKNTLNPVFEETLSFVQPLATLSSRTLWLSAWHADMFGRNDFLGEVTLPLADVVFDDPAPMWYKLHERTEQFDEHQGTRGDLIVALKFEQDAAARGKGTLHVLVKEAKNLVATKPNGLADVFCKSYLLPERGRLAKQKTSVVRRTLNPHWEHTFTYRGLSLQELATRALELSLWDRDRLASNDFMGAVRLSLGTGTYMGASVNWMDSMGKEVGLWQTMMQRPNLWVEGSLPLRPQLNN